MRIELKQVEFRNPHNDGKSGVYYFNDERLSVYYSEEEVLTEKLFFEKGIELWSEVYENGEMIEKNEIEKDSTSFIILERLRLKDI